jgi:hypothetical protein
VREWAYRVHFVEGSGVITSRGRRDPATVGLTRAGVLIAALGALLVVFNPWGVAVAGLVLAAVGTLLAARGGVGQRWYWMLAIGTVLIVLSRLAAEGAETLGGWLAVIGSILILCGTALGYPLASDLEE